MNFLNLKVDANKELTLKLSELFFIGPPMSSYPPRQKVRHYDTDEVKVCVSQISQGAKKVIFTACHLGKLKLTFTSPNIISTSPKNVLISRLISQFFCNLNSSKNFTSPSGKLGTEFTSPIAKSTSPGLSDTTFFVRCFVLYNAEKIVLTTAFAPVLKNTFNYM